MLPTPQRVPEPLTRKPKSEILARAPETLNLSYFLSQRLRATQTLNPKPLIFFRRGCQQRQDRSDRFPLPRAQKSPQRCHGQHFSPRRVWIGVSFQPSAVHLKILKHDTHGENVGWLIDSTFQCCNQSWSLMTRHPQRERGRVGRQHAPVLHTADEDNERRSRHVKGHDPKL